MISLIATFLMMNTSLGPRTAKALSWGVMGLLCALAIYSAYSWAWDRGRDDERNRWEDEVAEIRKERDDAMRELARRDVDAAKGIEQSITDNRKALDDETANIPDQPLSDRQRARACRELVRQGRRCEPPSPGS